MYERAKLQRLRVHARLVAFSSFGRPYDNARSPLSVECCATRPAWPCPGERKPVACGVDLPVEQLPGQTHCLTRHSDAVGLKERRRDGEEGDVCGKLGACAGYSGTNGDVEGFNNLPNSVCARSSSRKLCRPRNKSAQSRM
jgi:hypothetical protein